MNPWRSETEESIGLHVIRISKLYDHPNVHMMFAALMTRSMCVGEGCSLAGDFIPELRRRYVYIGHSYHHRSPLDHSTGSLLKVGCNPLDDAVHVRKMQPRGYIMRYA